MSLKVLTTGLGSFPQINADEALDLIFRYFPEVPFWPQLPKRSPKEGMVAQFSEKLPSRQDEELEEFYAKVIAEDLEYFAIGPEHSAGFGSFLNRLKAGIPEGLTYIKGQVTGPLTFAAAVNNGKGAALLYDPVLMQAIIKGLSMKGLWQINSFKPFGKKAIIFIDEPYLSGFGSAFTALNREEVISALTEITTVLKAHGALTAVHCCGNTDWSLLTSIETLDIISFDAFGFLDKFVLYARDIREFLERGGNICWGIAPTQEFKGTETPELLVNKLKDGLNSLKAKGIEEGLLLNNLFLSPSCGLGSLDAQKAEKILKLLSATSALAQQTL